MSWTYLKLYLLFKDFLFHTVLAVLYVNLALIIEINFANNTEWIEQSLRISAMLFASHFGGACLNYF